MRLSRIAIPCAAAMLAAACNANPVAPGASGAAPSARRADTSPQPLDCTKYAMAGANRVCESAPPP